MADLHAKVHTENIRSSIKMNTKISEHKHMKMYTHSIVAVKEQNR